MKSYALRDLVADREPLDLSELTVKFYGWFVIFCAHIPVYRRTRCDTIKCARVLRGIEETSCSTRPGGVSRKDVSCPRGCANACTCWHTGALPKYETAAASPSLHVVITRTLSFSLYGGFAFPCLSPRSRWNLETTSFGSNSINIACSYFAERYSLGEAINISR